MVTTRHTTFHEVMEGELVLRGESEPRPLRLELDADLPGLLLPWGDVVAELDGRVHAPGWADGDRATGTLAIAPLVRKRIRYQVAFTADDGRRLFLDGWKSVSYAHPLRSMTTLPATLTDAAGNVVGAANLRFRMRDLPALASSVRYGRSAAEDAPAYLPARWRGQPGRLEVWYTTLTDPATGTGLWLHHELVAPVGGEPAYTHGWAAVFPPGETPVFGRFGPESWRPPGAGGDAGSQVFTTSEVRVSARRLWGSAGGDGTGISWDLTAGDGARPLFTFPRWAWQRELLPAAQVVPAPTASFSGTLRYGGSELTLTNVPGATARVYGHGNAHRWAWLHADLGGGDVLEVVAATPTRPGLRRLPPLPFLRLRVGGREWPAGTLACALRLRAHVGLPSWTVSGHVRGRGIHIEVTQPPEETVSVDYADPDGAPATCHNTERASAVITLLERRDGRWHQACRWRLDGTAHAEVGTRD